MKIFDDDLQLEFKDYEQLSYYDSKTDYIDLYHKDQFVGYVIVYTDVENEKREYIIINHEIVYLDTLEKIN
jgi:hypothetical protein